MVFSLLLILLGIVLLYYGGEVLVDNSIHLARNFGLSRMVIGLTVVAFATSSPELAATITAALQGSPDIAIGNAFGSNIANLGLILGISVVIMPLAVKRRFLRREMAFMLFATIIVYPVMITGQELGRLEGAILFAFLVLFIYTLLQTRTEEDLAEDPENDDTTRSTLAASLGVTIGIALLVVGAKVLIQGATDIALALGISELVIGLTLVAFGTSLPELAASIVAARRKEGDLVLGNLVGSNIFNLLCILGLTALIHPINVAPAAMTLNYWVMFGISVLVLIFLVTNLRLFRVEGVVLLSLYVGYIVYLFY